MPRLDRLLSLYLARPIRGLRPISGDAVRILMYHRISEIAEPDVAPYYRLNTSPRRFAEQMEVLHDQGYTVVDLLEVSRLLRERSRLKKYVVITFDDGYADIAEHAFPVLARFGFPAAVFVPTEFIGSGPRKFRGVNCLTWTQIKELRSGGILFGSHTVSHPRLHDLTWEAVERELSESKQELENNLQESITTFAHPYAFPESDPAYVERLTGILSRAGYEYCATTQIGIARGGDSCLRLKRLPVNDCDDPAFFQAKLEGAYDWLSLPQRLSKRLRRQRRHSFSRSTPSFL